MLCFNSGRTQAKIQPNIDWYIYRSIVLAAMFHVEHNEYGVKNNFDSRLSAFSQRSLHEHAESELVFANEVKQSCYYYEL